MYLYIIKCGKYIKIGITNNVNERLRTLQTGNPELMEIVRSVSIPDDEAYEIENRLHRKFKKYKVRNEWFNISALKEIQNMTDEDLIKAEQEKPEVILWFLERTNKKELDKLSSSVVPYDINGFKDGFVFFKNKTMNPIREENLQHKHYYKSSGEVLNKLRDTYNECINEINKKYEKCKQYIENYNNKIEECNNEYNRIVDMVNELKERYGV